MGMTADKESSWTVFTVRISPELGEMIERYYEERDFESYSDALRVLVGAGLESEKIHEKALMQSIYDNAKASSMRRFDHFMKAALRAYRDMSIKLPHEEDDLDLEE